MSSTWTLAFALAIATPLVAQQNHRHSWAGVRAIPTDTRVLVSTVDDTWTPPKVRNIKGILDSSDADSVTVVTDASAVESIAKDSIVKVKVYQPPGKRMVAWIATAGTGIFMMSGAYSQGTGSLDRGAESFVLLLAAGVTAPVAYLAFRATRFKTVYHAP